MSRKPKTKAKSEDLKPILLDDELYLGDNGRCFCGKHAGASARYTGRDISGQEVLHLTKTVLERALRDDQPLPECETCTAQTRAALAEQNPNPTPVESNEETKGEQLDATSSEQSNTTNHEGNETMAKKAKRASKGKAKKTTTKSAEPKASKTAAPKKKASKKASSKAEPKAKSKKAAKPAEPKTKAPRENTAAAIVARLVGMYSSAGFAEICKLAEAEGVNANTARGALVRLKKQNAVVA